MTTAGDNVGELVAALVKARADIEARVYKAGFNRAQNYSYVGHEQVLLHARAALLKQGLALVQSEVSFLGALPYKTKAGEQLCWRWRGDFVLAHTSGAKMLFCFEATTNTNDKAGFVASTALDRTAHMRVLELAGSDEENPEHDSNETTRGGQPQVSGDMFADMVADLAQRTTPEALTQWARDLAVLNARGDQKKGAWEAFGVRCKSLGLDPAVVAANARKAA